MPTQIATRADVLLEVQALVSDLMDGSVERAQETHALMGDLALDSLDVREIFGTEGAASYPPTFSPNADTILFIRDGALWITTIDAAESRLSVRTYPVSDLVRASDEADQSTFHVDPLVQAITSNLASDSRCRTLA